jgi:serine/threonine-protein kinase HipA
MALLSCVGSDLPGGLQMLEPGTAPSQESGEIEWLEEEGVAQLLEEVRKDQSAWIAPGAKGRWSLAGAQAKIALLEVDGKWGRPTGAIPTNRILKPAPSEFDDHDINEHLCLNAAHRLGISAAPSRVMRFGSQRALVVNRYDRALSADGALVRIHQEDICQALGVMPEDKYEADGGPSAERIARLLREQIGEPQAGHAVRQFVDALIFNWLLAAPDAHAKNYSLLLSGRAVRLAPLYDVASALAYPGFHEPKIKLAMRIGRHYRVGAIGRTSWEREASSMGLDEEAVVARALDLAQRLPDAFSEAARSFQGPGEADPFAKVLAEKVIDRSKRCASRLQV